MQSRESFNETDILKIESVRFTRVAGKLDELFNVKETFVKTGISVLRISEVNLTGSCLLLLGD